MNHPLQCPCCASHSGTELLRAAYQFTNLSTVDCVEMCRHKFRDVIKCVFLCKFRATFLNNVDFTEYDEYLQTKLGLLKIVYKV